MYRTVFSRIRLRAIAAVFLSIALGLAPDVSDASETRRTVALVAGQMTSNGIDEVFLPGKTDFINAGFAGVALGWEAQLDNPRWRAGIELQVNQHFGKNDHQEIVAPLTIRYSPDRPWPRAIDSFAFGLGLSHATSTPNTEIARRGNSQRTLVYFSLETAFAVGDRDSTLFLRLHHRSDAYGLMATDSGSNAFALGFRKSF